MTKPTTTTAILQTAYNALRAETARKRAEDLDYFRSFELSKVLEGMQQAAEKGHYSYTLKIMPSLNETQASRACVEASFVMFRSLFAGSEFDVALGGASKEDGVTPTVVIRWGRDYC